MAGVVVVWAGYTLAWWGIQLARHSDQMAPLTYAALGLGGTYGTLGVAGGPQGGTLY